MKEQTLQRLDYHRIQQLVSGCALSYLGRKHAQDMKPIADARLIQIRLGEADEAVALIRYGASVPIPSLDGMETIMNLLGTGYLFNEQDFGHLAQFLRSCAQLMKYMEGKAGAAPTVSRYAASMMQMEQLLGEIERSIHAGRIQDHASKELARIRKKMAVSSERMKRKLDALVSKHRSIMQEHVISQRNGRAVLPIKKEFRKQVKGSVLDESGSGQTVYIEPAELVGLQMELSSLQAEESREEMKILGDLTALAESYSHEIKLNVDTVGILDFLFAKAKFAASMDGVVVRVNTEGRTRLLQARHPLMGKSMVPLDFSIGDSYSSLIITGPNTGGKTVALKTLGLLTLMMQSGLLVPVAEGSEMAVFEEMAVDIGDGQSMEQALSTFSAHIRNMIGILEQAGPSTLVLIDEMASGTDPGEGVGLSIAMLEELHRRGATVVATTHFGEIKHFAAATPGFENARMEFDTVSLQPLYRLRIGEAGESYAYAIAQKLGMPERIIERSKAVSSQGMAEKKERREMSEQEMDSIQPGSGSHPDDQRSVQETQRFYEQGMGHPDNHASGQTATFAPIQAGSQTGAGPQLAKQHSKLDATVHERADTQPGSDSDESESILRAKAFRKGDRVFAAYLNETGTVYETEDKRGNIGVLMRGNKIKIHKKRLTLHIAAEELYPDLDHYDLDIVLDTKENRKKRKQMARKHVDGLIIETPPEH